MMKQRNTEAGFTVADMMAVVALMGSAVWAIVPGSSRPSATADRGGFAEQVTEELQRTRAEAVTTRVPRYAFIFSNRVEIRAAKRSAAARGWVAPTESDPVLRTVRAKPGIHGVDVTSKTGLPSFNLSPTTSKEIVFGTLGTGVLDSTGPGRATPIHLYFTNDTVRNDHPDREFRVDIAPASGVVSLQRKW